MNILNSILRNKSAMRWIKISAIVGGVLTVSALAYLKYLGAFETITFEKTTTRSRNIIYRQYQGGFRGLPAAFQRMEGDFKETFTMKESLGLYYDDPNLIADQSKMRMIIACVVEEDELERIPEYLEINLNYDHTLLPETKVVQSLFPFRNFLSHFVGPVKFYSACDEWFKQDDEFKDCKDGDLTAMEIYNGLFISYNFVYGKQLKNFDLSIYDKPESKKLE